MTNAHLTVGIRRNETIWSAPDEEFDGTKLQRSLRARMRFQRRRRIPHVFWRRWWG